MVKSDYLESFARRLLRVHILTMVDDAELKARVSRARASLIVNPISGRHYSTTTKTAPAKTGKEAR